MRRRVLLALVLLLAAHCGRGKPLVAGYEAATPPIRVWVENNGYYDARVTEWCGLSGSHPQEAIGLQTTRLRVRFPDCTTETRFTARHFPSTGETWSSETFQYQPGTEVLITLNPMLSTSFLSWR